MVTDRRGPAFLVFGKLEFSWGGTSSAWVLCAEMLMYKLCFYVPESHLDEVKEAVFAAGGGRIGAYDQCCWQVLGCGQYRPLEGSQPYLGEPGKVQPVSEWKVEMVVTDELIHDCVKALKRAHPYETPAYDVWRLSDMVF